jgi:hypothetical protein
LHQQLGIKKKMFRFRADNFVKSADSLLRILKNDRIVISKFQKRLHQQLRIKKKFRFLACGFWKIRGFVAEDFEK